MSCRIRFFALLLLLLSLFQGCAAPSRWGEADVRDAIGIADFGPAQGGSGGGAASTLQQVTDAGATTTTQATFSGGVVASEVILDAANKDAFITPTATAGEFTFGSTAGAKNGKLYFDNWESDTSGTSTTFAIRGSSTRADWVFNGAGILSFDAFGANTGVFVAWSRILGWRQNPNATGSEDTSISRNAAGEVAIGTGASGSTNATLLVDGLVLGYVAKTAAYTATRTDHTIACDATTAAFTVTLPPAASNAGLILVVKKTDASANAITIDGNAAETIDGATTQSLATQWSSLTIQCDGAGWLIL